MNDFFQSIFQHTQTATGTNTNTTAIPPASQRAIRQLPLIRVTPEDLIDPNNRECCICLADVQVNDVMCRMPYCGHLFHKKPCLEDWLSRHCTCPICRVELETEDAEYERGRKQRMRLRKHRFHLHELQRMSVTELKNWCSQLHISIPVTLREKQELIDLLCRSNQVQIILESSHGQIIKEYDSIEVLRAMSVGQLKREMLDCGVSYELKSVVEKEDIIQIFVNSGRILLRYTDDDDDDDDEQKGSQSTNVTSYNEKNSRTMTKNNDGGFQDHSDDQRNNNNTNANTNEGTHGIERLMKESVSSLKGMAAVLDVNISDCIEKREMVERIHKKQLHR